MNRHQRRRAEARARQPLPGYQHRLRAAAPELATMRDISHCMIEHDHACAIFQRHPCNCTPDISITNDGSVLVIDEHGAVSRTSKQ